MNKDTQLVMENYEQKYNEALERAKEFMTNKGVAPNADAFKTAKELIGTIFPELRESEDERIRKIILSQMKQWNQEALKENCKIDFEVSTKCIAWLKKQGEQKTAPKFKIGDTIHKIGENTVFPRTIEKIEDGDYVCNNSHSFINIKFQDDYELVEQKPADKVEPKFKIGDWVINNDKRIAIPTQILKIEKYGYGTSMGYTSFDKVKTDYHIWTIQDAKDGDVLVAKIDEEPNDFIYIFEEYDQNLGFWSHCYLDAYINKFHEGEHHNNYNVGVPATKEQRDLLFQKMKEAGYEWDAEKKELKKMEQNPTWSEEDEEEFQIAIDTLVKAGQHDSANWLKSLKDRIQPQPKQEWSEEDEREREQVVGLLKGWLSTFKETYYAKDCKRGIAWLESIRPKNTWKPSDEQIRELRCVISGCSFETPILMQLEKDLKKLRGE